MADKLVEQRFNEAISISEHVEDNFMVQVANHPKFQDTEAREELSSRDSFSDVEIEPEELEDSSRRRSKVGPTGLTQKTYKHLKFGQDAMRATGAQSEFVAANQLQAQALNCAVILRAGDPPQYNKRRSPKSGVNLSKSSKQGFYKGALAKDPRFGRIGPKAYKPKELDNLTLPATDPNYQHTMHLDINIRDILRELADDGDLEVLGFDQGTGQLRLAYKPGRGPADEAFKGQFVINLSEGEDTPLFYSREWDRPENDPNWDPGARVIKQPEALSCIPEVLYRHVFNHTFKVNFTEDIVENPSRFDLKKAEVFANRPRSAHEFRKAMELDSNSPIVVMIAEAIGVNETSSFIAELKECASLEEILDKLHQTLGEEKAEELIKATYDAGGSIIAGDWDGMALGHPKGLDEKYLVVYNTFAKGEQGLEQIEGLFSATEDYFEELKSAALEKQSQQEPLTAFEEQLLSIDSLSTIISQFSKERAGCITPHEFLFEQVLNAAYREQSLTSYRERYNQLAVQVTMSQLLQAPKDLNRSEEQELIGNLLSANFENEGQNLPLFLKEKLVEHLSNHLKIARRDERVVYVIPHLNFDHNVHDLYQHGFDMRNPYGCDLGEDWLMVLPDGGVISGDRQQDLVEVMLIGDFLEQNQIDVNHGVDMSIGWDRVIERQIELNQRIPQETMVKYCKYKEERGESIMRADPNAEQLAGN